jgi:hypothetical protein
VGSKKEGVISLRFLFAYAIFLKPSVIVNHKTKPTSLEELFSIHNPRELQLRAFCGKPGNAFVYAEIKWGNHARTRKIFVVSVRWKSPFRDSRFRPREPSGELVSRKCGSFAGRDGAPDPGKNEQSQSGDPCA